MDLDNAFNINKKTWNDRVAIHAQSDFYKLAAFKKGGSSLNRFELEALGDVSGKSLLHLQCHFGQDTLSFSRLGARCTGIDFSEKAIAFAQNLNKELALDASFICCNVLDTSNNLTKTFDIVFTSYGTIGWLPDLKPWAQMISERLKKGGIFYIVDFHPIVWMFSYLESPPKLVYPYSNKDVIYEDVDVTAFDLEKDGDLDLYVMSGGNESVEGDPYLEDRVYINDGNANFRRLIAPLIKTNGGSVSSGDFDGDGFDDLFIGNRSMSRGYGLSPYSFILKRFQLIQLEL